MSYILILMSFQIIYSINYGETGTLQMAKYESYIKCVHKKTYADGSSIFSSLRNSVGPSASTKDKNISFVFKDQPLVHVYFGSLAKPARQFSHAMQIFWCL